MKSTNILQCHHDKNVTLMSLDKVGLVPTFLTSDASQKFTVSVVFIS
jgi:hypothetical protein